MRFSDNLGAPCVAATRASDYASPFVHATSATSACSSERRTVAPKRSLARSAQVIDEYGTLP